MIPRQRIVKRFLRLLTAPYPCAIAGSTRSADCPRNPRFWNLRPRVTPLILPDELADRLFPVGDRSQAADLAIRFRYCHSYRFGMDIQTQKS